MKKLFKNIIIVLMIVLISTPAQAATKKQITSSTKKITVVAGHTYNLKVKGAKVTWKAVKNSYIVLTKSGKLTVKKAGKVKIKYTINKKAKSISVVINKKKSNSSTSDDIITEDPNKSESLEDPDPPVISDDDTNPQDSSSNDEVWLSATGEKYHRINNCGNMNPNTARKVTLAYAKSHGFIPCTKCF